MYDSAQSTFGIEILLHKSDRVKIGGREVYSGGTGRGEREGTSEIICISTAVRSQ